MYKSDIFRVEDIWTALKLLTRLPSPEPNWDDETSAARAAWAYPIAGLALAALAALFAYILLATGLSAGIVAGATILTLAMASGAMHEDGLADCADGFWGGWDKDRRLKIMKDSSIGTYGVIALLVAIGLRWWSLTLLFSAGWIIGPLVVTAMVSRSAMTWVMLLLPHARADGLAVQTGKPDQQRVWVSSAISAFMCLILIGFGTVFAAGLVALGVLLISHIARDKIEGQTGDVLGATQQVSEVLLLCLLTLML